MPLLLFHSPKGGVGSTFLAAHCAMELAARGHEPIAIDFTYQGSLKLFFGLLPDQPIVRAGDDSEEELVAAGVELLDGYRLGRKAAFLKMLADPDASPFPSDKLIIADVAAADHALKQALLPHAVLQVCTITPGPVALASLTKVDPAQPLAELQKTLIVVNLLDDTRTLARHSNIFLHSAFERLLAGTVRQDEAVNEAVAKFETLERFRPTSAALADVRAVVTALEEHCNLGPRKEGEEG
ncbi:cellulose synthase operon protein YhjQ/BcsQ [Altericroceibacterium xinjiangense]|uniref:cellulose synthase operon protein YhjQ/BcsQ n=1 Tax=Altericroceibacterium xinjiangense TaxID=762261 RepID=UPI000F7DA135|nr:cellulose synthase operon protein YhjQ/BcsQ [Altericroceibacterium xinjiangense]